MKRVYVASALSAPTPEGVAANIARAREHCLVVLREGHAPLAPHVLYGAVLDDADPADRELGLRAGGLWLSVADELWAFGEVTPGMAREIRDAELMGIPVVRRPA